MTKFQCGDILKYRGRYVKVIEVVSDREGDERSFMGYSSMGSTYALVVWNDIFRHWRDHKSGQWTVSAQQFEQEGEQVSKLIRLVLWGTK